MNNYAYAEPAVVYGIRVEDPRAAILVKRVLNISILSGLLVICSTIYMYTSDTFPQDNTDIQERLVSSIFGILVALLVPACGYFGAKQRDKGLLTMFWVCNCVGSCCSFLGIGLLAATGALLQETRRCLCENAATPIYNPTTKQCVAGSTNLTCESLKQENYTSAVIVYVASAILSCFACMYGRELAQTPMFVTMKTEYVAAPVGTIAVDNEQGADYAELK